MRKKIGGKVNPRRGEITRKTIKLYKTLAASGTWLSVKELEKRTGIHYKTIRRMLFAFEQEIPEMELSTDNNYRGNGSAYYARIRYRR